MILETLDLAVRALRRNVMRTALTMLGIMIGVGAVIAMVAIGTGAKSQVEAQIASMGQNMLMVMSGNMSRGGVSMGFGSAGQLTRQDYEALRHEISDVTAVSPEIRASAQVAAGNQNESLTVVGASEGYLTIRNWPLTSGADFTEADVRATAKVALIGKTTAKTLFGDSDPVGQIVRIRSTPFTIVGLLAAKGANAMGDDQDDTLILPYTSAMVRLTGDTTFRSFTLQAGSTEAMSDVQAQITNLLRQRHRITNGKEDDFMVHTQTELSEMATSTSRIMTLLLGAVRRLAGGRWHRRDEHHAGQRDRTHPRDWRAHGHRRARQRHPAPVPG
jgi:putative ABC transport system permease protein